MLSLLEEFLHGEYYAIAPLHVAKKLRNGTLNICTIDNGPSDEIIYYLTSENFPTGSVMDRALLTLEDKKKEIILEII